MNEAVTLTHIHEDIIALRKEIEEVKEKISDVDEFLSEDDKKDLKSARLEYKEGEVKSLDELEKKWR